MVFFAEQGEIIWAVGNLIEECREVCSPRFIVGIDDALIFLMMKYKTLPCPVWFMADVTASPERWL